MTEESGDKNRSFSEHSDVEYDPAYTPIVTLPEVPVVTNEEDEELLLKLRAKLYRFDRSDDIPEWKERGTGDLKFLRHNVNKTVRIVMRRDKTLKVCANHFITPLIVLKPMQGLERAFIYTVLADFSDEEVKSECFAIKFGTVDIANQFKKAFLEAQEYVNTNCKIYNGEMEKEEGNTTDEDSEEDDEDDDDDNKGEKEVTITSEKADKADKISAEITEKLGKLEVNKENGKNN